jgi:hypothetical protein
MVSPGGMTSVLTAWVGRRRSGIRITGAKEKAGCWFSGVAKEEWRGHD